MQKRFYKPRSSSTLFGKSSIGTESIMSIISGLPTVSSEDIVKITSFKIKKIKKMDYEPGVMVSCKGSVDCANCSGCAHRHGSYMSLPFDYIAPTVKLSGYLTKFLVDTLTDKIRCLYFNSRTIKYSFFKERSGTLMQIIPEDGSDELPYYVTMFKKYSSDELKSRYVGRVFTTQFRFMTHYGRRIMCSREDMLKERFKESINVHINKVKSVVNNNQPLINYLTKNYRYTKKHLITMGNITSTNSLLSEMVASGYIRLSQGRFYRTRKLLYILLSLFVEIRKVVRAVYDEAIVFLKNINYYKKLLFVDVDT
jgi:hypothetical protein